jgi:hypothetical protein
MDNPVQWWPWSESALREARKRNKPILLSIGYAACHWCHVMAHESFEDATTAALMNDLFVNIKVDREERPDLDVIYQSALAVLGENGGWPLTMFLTPSGEPFWGGTYFPPTPRYGRPGFKDVLQRVSDAYANKRDAVAQSVAAIAGAMKRLTELPAGGTLVADISDKVAARLIEDVDMSSGGFGSAPKFPQPTIFELIWRAYLRTANVRYRNAVTLTLDRMCQGGIYDHLGGGFARYSVDAEWLVPHFEKMLYDNAQMIELLTLVWPETRNPLYRQRVAETIEWTFREMRHHEGGYFSSIDADSEGEEGRFYRWTESEIDALLGSNAAVFKTAYDVTRAGNWDGYTILNRRHAPDLGDEQYEARLASLRSTLLRARAKRVRPALDDKVLADWNGLLITALANAGTVFHEPRWLDAAACAFQFVRTHMFEGGRLRHCWRDGQLRHPATIDDHANLSRAALALFEATGNNEYLSSAEHWVALADAHYWDADHGGYFLSADDTRDVLLRVKPVHDQSVPAGNSTMVAVLGRLFHLTGKSAYRDRADATLTALSGEIARSVSPLASLVNAHSLLNAAIQIILIGTADDPALSAMRRTIYDVSLPDRILHQVTTTRAFPATHPAFGKTAVDGRPTAYICRGPVCSLPITDIESLRDNLHLARP